MKSIISNEKQCFFCGSTYNIQKHHIYGGGNRVVSEDNGFWLYLCQRHHTYTNYSVHGDPQHKSDLMLKKICQTIYENKHSRDDFIKLIGKSYL